MGKVSIGETLKIARTLKDNGVDSSKLQLTKIVNGRFSYLSLGELEQVGADIQKIIKENNLDPEYPYGTGVRILRSAYRGNYKITEEEKRETKELGLISKREMNKKGNTKGNGSTVGLSIKGTSQERALKIVEILKVNGVDPSKLQLTKIVNGRTKCRLLEELEQEGVDIQKIIAENGLDGKFEIGAKIMAMIKAYRGVGVYEMTKKDRKKVEEVGIIPKALISKESQEVGEALLISESLEEKEKRKRELMKKTEQARHLFEKYNQLENEKEHK